MVKKLSAFAFTSLIILAGCRSTQAITGDELLGAWVYDEGGYAIEFMDDGSYTVGAFDPPEFGEFTLEGKTLTLMTGKQARVCAGLVGTYQIELTSDSKLHMTLVTDECSIRADTVDDSFWSRPSYEEPSDR